MENKFYEEFENSLEQELLRLCTSLGKLSSAILCTDDLDAVWREFAPSYMSDAVSQIAEFPEAATAWAGYLGMAVAHNWDEDWAAHNGDSYESYYGSRGFDDMDDHIVRDILGFSLDSTEAKEIVNIMMACTQAAIGKIKRENVEPSSKKAFYIFASTVKVMFRIGASLELKRLGYSWTAVPVGRYS